VPGGQLRSYFNPVVTRAAEKLMLQNRICFSYCRLLPPRLFATSDRSKRYGGSVWESNPPPDPRRAGSPALKARKVTGPLSPPLVCTPMLAQDLIRIGDRA